MRLAIHRGVVLALVAAVGLVAQGCGKGDDRRGAADPKPEGQKAGKESGKTAQAAGEKGHDHNEWWCAEHGIPEHLCSLCSEQVAKACRAKGDWCDKHERAKSQCFKCDPKLKEKIAAMYRAKYGKEPPPITDE
jgi:hypothetical protein